MVNTANYKSVLSKPLSKPSQDEQDKLIEKVLMDMAIQQKVYQQIMQRNYIELTHHIEKALFLVNVEYHFTQAYIEIRDTAVQIPETRHQLVTVITGFVHNHLESSLKVMSGEEKPTSTDKKLLDVLIRCFAFLSNSNPLTSSRCHICQLQFQNASGCSGHYRSDPM